MTAPVNPVASNIAAVLDRIAQIQQRISPPSLSSLTNASSASSSASATSSNATASSASGANSTVGGDFATALARFTNSAATGQSGDGVTGDQVVADAKQYLGIPYVFGGTTTSGLDCSGLVQKAYGDLGISMPRLAADQAKVGAAVPSLAQAQPGDVLAFGDPAYHVAIYLGDNQMIAAPEPGENVKIQSVYQTPTTIRRIVGGDTASNQADAGVSTAGNAGISAAVQQYDALFSQNESQYNLPTRLLSAVAQTESGGNAQAVSPAGAEGLMQLMPTTAAGLGVNPWDASQSIQGAAKLLSNYLTKYQSVPLALAAYNAGPGAVSQYGGVPPYTETQNYVTKITGLMNGAST